MTHTAEPMTLESMRDFHRKLATEHKVIPPLSDAHAAMADAIDAELAKQREAEPVARVRVTNGGVIWRIHNNATTKSLGIGDHFLYTHPQQRNAVEVTEAMVNAGAKFVHDHGDGDLKPQAFYAGIFNEMLKANQSPSFELCRFNHHPDPAIDFCVEVESLLGEIENQRIGFKNGTPAQHEIDKRIERALDFKVGGDQGAVLAKQQLLAALSAVASRDREDAERLDWIQKQIDAKAAVWIISSGDKSFVQVRWSEFPEVDNYPIGENVRDALDAARRENKP